MSGLTCLMMSPLCSLLPDSQVCFDLLIRRHLGDVLLGFILVVALHTHLNKWLRKRWSSASWEMLSNSNFIDTTDMDNVGGGLTR